MHNQTSAIPHLAAGRTHHPVPLDHRVDAHDPARTGPLADVPKWITLDLIRQTIRVWQPYYKAALTVQDAVAMLQNVRRLGRILAS